MKIEIFLLVLGLIGVQSGLAYAEEASAAAESVLLFDVTDTANLRKYTRNACEAEVIGSGGSRVLEVRYGCNSDWPNIFFRQRIFAFSDWSKYNALAVTVSNPTENIITVNIRVDDAAGNLRQGGYGLEPGKKVKLYMDMSLTQNKISNMRGQPPGVSLGKEEGAWTDDNQAPVDSSKIAGFQIYMAKPSISHVIHIHKIELARFPLSGKEKAAAFVDRFGQYNGAVWPGKLNNEAEFGQRLKSEEADLENNPPPPDRGGFGGWKEGPKLKPSGHFRVEKYNGKWWFVDPDGFLFWSSGVDCVGASEATMVAGREGCFTWLPSKKQSWALFHGAGITADKEEVISGKGSLKADALESDIEWNEFFHTDPQNAAFKPLGEYTVSFKYNILEKKGDSSLYFLMRSKAAGDGPPDKGFTFINDSGEGEKEVTFILEDHADYYMIFGVQKKASVVIDDIRVRGTGEGGKTEEIAGYGFEPEESRDPLLAFYGQGTYDFFAANLFRNYGKSYRKTYFETSAKRLLSWGFNTVGNWSDINSLSKLRVPYTASAGSGMAPQFKVDNRDFPDVFHPGFAEGVGKSLKGLARFKDDPWFLGVFIDNEFPWYPNGKLAAIALEQASGCCTKREAAAYLEQKFGSIDKLNNSWSTRLESWDDLAGQPLKLSEQQQNRARRDLVEIEGMMAMQYFGKCREMADKYLPGILYFGSRFSSFSREVVEAAKKYCDAVCFNIYAELPIDNEGDELAKEMDFPILVGEFHFGALDRGMFHTGLRAARDQDERARKLENYIRAAVTHPNFVGTHWFQFVDESLTGRWFDGENYNIGFLTVTDDPYPEMRAGARSINRELYKLRSSR